MENSFGEIIRRERARRGWDQAELAERAGVGQQTVSGWERGTSRPRRAAVGHLAEMLERDVVELLRAAGYVATADAPSQVESPVRPRLTTLPLHQLPADVFEHLAADLARQLYPGAEVHLQGSQGHTQDGLDIVIEQPSGKPIGIQCKRESQFGPKKVRDAVTKLKLPVAESFIFLSRVASPDARNEMRKHARWQLWDAVDISRAIRELSKDAAVRLVDTYFPRWREPFLGVDEPGPWLTAGDYFRTSTGRIYSHEWELVGRADELDGLLTFAASASEQVATVVGRGGVGKSRLLRQLADDAGRDRDIAVRFVAQSVEVRPEHFDLLPSTNRLLVVIDDAHDRVDNAAIVAGVLRSRPRAKVLIALRPYGLGQLASELRRVYLHPTELRTWNLDDLRVDAARDLARQTLGPRNSAGMIQRLAAIGADCPLLIVVAAALLRRGALDSDRLEASESIRSDVLEAFRDALVTDPTSGDPELRRAVLHAMSALQPFRIADPDFQSALAEITGRPFDIVLSHIRSLEDGGVLLRRGSSLRVVPDLLGDVILSGATTDSGSGVSTGYLERVQRAVRGAALQHVIINVGRVDWQVRQARPGAPSLMEALWATVEEYFRAADADGRVAMLTMLRRVAYFQPRRALDLVRWTLAHIAAVGTDSRVNDPYATTDEHVLRELPQVVENIAYNRDLLPDALDLLWQLAQGDERPTNQHPGHPLRILQNLAEYQIGKSRLYSDAVIAATERWLTQPGGVVSSHSPLDALEPILATEGEDRTFDERQVTLRSFSLITDTVLELRARAVKLVLSEVSAADPRRAVRAVQAMDAALRYPSGLFGRTVSEAERDRWTTVFATEIKQFADAVADTEQDPVVSVAVRQALRWHAHSSGGTRTAARSALKRLPQSTEHDLALVLHDGWGRLLDRGDDHEKSEQVRQSHFAAVAAAAIARWADHELVDQLVQRIEVDRRAFVGGTAGNPAPFVWSLVWARPSVGIAVCRRIVDDPTSVLLELVPDVLNRLLDSEPAAGMELADEMLATGSLPVARHIAAALAWARGDRPLAEGEAELLRSFVAHDDPTIRRVAVQAARTLSKSQRMLALDLITTTQFSDDKSIADEVFAVLGPHGNLSWRDLSDEHANALLGQLRQCYSIDEYHIIAFLSHLSAYDPEAAIKLLIDRVDTKRRERDGGYQPLPFTWHQPLQVRAHERFPTLLRMIRDWIANGDSQSGRNTYGPEVFRVVAQDFDAQTLEVLDEALLTGLPEQIKAVGVILQDAPRTLVWDDVEFVTRALRTAEQHGEEYVRSVGGGLHQAVTTGSRMGAVGEPFQEDIEQRDRSAEIERRLPRGSIEQRFYRSLVAAAESSIKWETEHDRPGDGRSW